MRPAAIARSQLAFLWRHGIFAVYTVFVAVLTALVLLLPRPWAPLAAAASSLADPMLVGFFFLGSLSLLERKQGTVHALLVLPRGSAVVLWTRALIFGAVGVLAMACLMAAGGVSWLGILVAILPVLIGSVSFTVLAMGLSLAVPSMNAWLGLAGLALLPGFAGTAYLFGLDHPAFSLSPAWGVSVAMTAALEVSGGKAYTLWGLPAGGAARFLAGCAHATLFLFINLSLYRALLRRLARGDAQ